jgi:hypothetical protein
MQAINLAKQIAKDISEEPEKIIEETKEQLTGIEPQETQQIETPQVSEENEKTMQIQGQRQLQALENEIKDIQIQKEREKMIQEKQAEQSIEPKSDLAPMLQVSLKPSRRMGMANKAKQQQTRIEKPLPPTG